MWGYARGTRQRHLSNLPHFAQLDASRAALGHRGGRVPSGSGVSLRRRWSKADGPRREVSQQTTGACAPVSRTMNPTAFGTLGISTSAFFLRIEPSPRSADC